MRVPLRVTWGSMVLAKLANAARPSRVVLHFATVALMATALSGLSSVSWGSAAVQSFLGFTALRLVVIAVSAQLDRAARRYDQATLVIEPDTLLLEFADGTVEEPGWDWLLAVREGPSTYRLQSSVRRGRLWLFLSRDRLRASGEDGALRALFVERGLLT
jgi:hypothetical protein